MELEHLKSNGFLPDGLFIFGGVIMNKPLKPCNEPCCPTLTREGYCEQHKRTKPAYDQYRKSASKRG